MTFGNVGIGNRRAVRHSYLVLASSNPTPVALGWRAALLALDLAHQAADHAHWAMIYAEPGALLGTVDAWREAEAVVERCLLRERTERLKACGKRWLRAVPT